MSDSDLMLSVDAFERLLAELEEPAAAVPKLVELFEQNPELPHSAD